VSKCNDRIDGGLVAPVKLTTGVNMYVNKNFGDEPREPEFMWSHDGSRIVLVGNPNTTIDNIYILNMSGGFMFNLTNGLSITLFLLGTRTIP